MNKLMQFGLATIFSGLALQTATAHALYRRTPGAVCVPLDGETSSAYDFVQAASSAGRLDLGCPLPEDDRLPKQSVTQVHVHGHNAGGTVFAEVCDKHWFDNSAEVCTNFFTSTATEFAIAIDGANLSGIFNATNSSDTAGVYVILPSTASTVRQIFQGS